MNGKTYHIVIVADNQLFVICIKYYDVISGCVNIVIRKYIISAVHLKCIIENIG